MPGKMPERKPFGRDRPPGNYPTDPSQYADPQNYMYPLDKPFRAKLARRYFDELRNRNKYTEQERLFIDSRIDEALKRFGITADETRAPTPSGIERRESPRRASRDELDRLDLDDLLQRFLGAARLERAKSIPDSLVTISSIDRNAIAGHVKQYIVQIDLKNRIITHDCDDSKNRMRSKQMCKHLGKAFLMIGESKAVAILRQILTELENWTFNAAWTPCHMPREA